VGKFFSSNAFLKEVRRTHPTLAYIEGGVLTGVIAGNADDKPLIEDAQIQGADLLKKGPGSI